MRLEHLCSARLSGNEPRQERDVVEEVIRYINENLDREIHRQDLADHVYLNPDYLNRLFKKQTGKTLKEFVIEHKIDEAKKMLQVESSKVCQDVNFLSKSMKIELVPYVIRKLNIGLNCQYANIHIRTSK